MQFSNEVDSDKLEERLNRLNESQTEDYSAFDIECDSDEQIVQLDIEAHDNDQQFDKIDCKESTYIENDMSAFDIDIECDTGIYTNIEDSSINCCEDKIEFNVPEDISNVSKGDTELKNQYTSDDSTYSEKNKFNQVINEYSSEIEDTEEIEDTLDLDSLTLDEDLEDTEENCANDSENYIKANSITQSNIDSTKVNSEDLQIQLSSQENHNIDQNNTKQLNNSQQIPKNVLQNHKLNDFKNKEEIRMERHKRYQMITDQRLMEYVSKFMIYHNVANKAIDKRILDKQFGQANIQKLINRSYLINLNGKITIGF